MKERRVRVSVSIRADLLQMIKYTADINGRSVSNEIETRLQKSMFHGQQASKRISHIAELMAQEEKKL